MSDDTKVLGFPAPGDRGRWQQSWRPYIEARLRKHGMAEPVIAEMCERMQGYYTRSGMAAPLMLSEAARGNAELAFAELAEHFEAQSGRLLVEILRLETFIYSELPNVPRPADG